MDEKKYRVDKQDYAEGVYKDGPVKNVLPSGEKERKLITRLANHIQTLPGVKVIAGDPEYNALACCVSDDEAKLVLSMKLRKHYTLDDIAKKNKMPVEKVEPMLKELAMTGILMFDPEDPEAGPDKNNQKQGGYWIPIFVPGIMECLVDNVKLAEAHPEIPKAFNEYTIKRIMPLAGNLPVGGGVMRVIPIESAIKDDPKHTVDEEISHYVETATDICVSPCSCRVARRIQGEGCGHLEDDMCIQFNEAARAFIHAGRGPILKGKAPVLRGLGAETRRAVSSEPHFGQRITSSSSKASSSKVCRQALHSKSYSGMSNSSREKWKAVFPPSLLLSKHPTPAGKVKAKAFFVPEEGVGKIW